MIKNTSQIPENKLTGLTFFSSYAESQNRQTGTDTLLHTAVRRLGALLVLMLTVGDWSDVIQVLITFLGEAVCLLPSQDLLEAVLEVCVNNLFHSETVILIMYFALNLPFLHHDYLLLLII